MNTSSSLRSAVVIGAGPSGLMAAQTLCEAGVQVHVYDAMPSVGRKFLLAGIGGLNLTHAEPLPQFVSRYGARASACGVWLERMGPQAVRAWAHSLGIDTFVGSSQRVFPTDMKAAPLLRAWLQRLRHPAQGLPVRFHMRQRWNHTLHAQGAQWQLGFDTPQGTHTVQADAVVLALGGGSWSRLGSDGTWQDTLRAMGIDVVALQPSNCGFDVSGGWSSHLAERFAGQALKGVVLSYTDVHGQTFTRKGELVVTATGIEGSLVYAASAGLRTLIQAHGQAQLTLNLRPDLDAARVRAEVAHPRGSRSLSSHLKSRLGLTPLHLALLHEVLDKQALLDPARLAHAIAHLPLQLSATRPLDEAISSAGGVRLEALDDALMSRQHPGLFVAGEMLDWEAPTGGYLLTACLASGRVAGAGAAAYLGGSSALHNVG